MTLFIINHSVVCLGTLFILANVLAAAGLSLIGTFLFTLIRKRKWKIRMFVKILALLTVILVAVEIADFQYERYEGRWCFECDLGDWPEKAAHGDPLAEEQMGIRYEQNLGVRQDYAEAMKWYLKAAAQGNWDAMDAIGDLYDKGEGVTRNAAEAKRWHDRARKRCLQLKATRVRQKYDEACPQQP